MKKIPTVRGANLGNWFVLEKWMSPSMFEGTEALDEYHLARTLPEDVYRERIRRHRAEYITEHDFALLHQWGFNAVRIPIPYSVFGDCPPYLGCIEELDRAFTWAERWGLKILLDLHTVPGSQNGFDNGGICGVCKWATDEENVSFALDVLHRLALRYGKRDGLWGIEALNEPITDALTGDIPWDKVWIINVYPPKDPKEMEGSAPIKMEFLRKFYEDAYAATVPYMADDKYFVFHDAFRTALWKDFMQGDRWKNAVLDTHFYLSNAEVGGCEKTPEGYEAVLNGHFVKLFRDMSEHFPIICGEWCIDNSYIKTLSDPKQRDAVLHRLAKVQMETWEQGSGWFYWNYKTLSDDPALDTWDVGKCILHGWMEPMR